MTPILGRGRLGLYLAAWAPVAILLAALAGASSPRSWREAFALVVPLAAVHAFICLSSWYLCRAMPLDRTGPLRLIVAHAVAAGVSTGVWLGLGTAWAAALAQTSRDPGVLDRFREDRPVFLGAGILLFVLVAASHYLLLAFEASREAERRAFGLQVLATEAQLTTLTSQVNPHFLYNSLNSISALVASDPQGARRMCLMLADLLRSSLNLGSRTTVALSEEIALLERFLAVEAVRFGERLRVEVLVDPDAARCAIPPLILQPLVENSVIHGVASLVEGGTIRIRAGLVGPRLVLSVENPRDPDTPPRIGPGMGLGNVRARLSGQYGPEGRLEIESTADRHLARIIIPAIETSRECRA